jgi:hypothetical protein
MIVFLSFLILIGSIRSERVNLGLAKVPTKVKAESGSEAIHRHQMYQ